MLRGDYITEYLFEINRRVGFIDERKANFKNLEDYGIKNMRLQDEVEEVIYKLNRKLDEMRDELYAAKSKLVENASDMGEWSDGNKN